MSSKLNIFGMTVPVRMVDMTKIYPEMAETAGFFDPTKKQIVIDKNQDEISLLQTLLHEMIHAIFFRMGILQTQISMDIQEILCENISVSIVENSMLMKGKNVKKKKAKKSTRNKTKRK